jgi:hypothetical protein
VRCSEATADNSNHRKPTGHASSGFPGRAARGPVFPRKVAAVPLRGLHKRFKAIDAR